MSRVLNLISNAAFAWRRDTVIGRMIRLPLRVVPEAAVVPILSGPAKGLKWNTGAGVADFWLGTYERKKAELFSRHARPGNTFYDVGANVGFYTLLAARALGPSGQVIAFEPSPRNFGFLQEHLRLNHITNVKALEIAISDSEGETRFAQEHDPKLSKIAAAGGITVRTTSLDRLRGELPLPNLIEMDIEGAEYSALRGAEQMLRASKPVIFLSTHGREVHQLCCALLRALDYELHAIGPRSVEDTDELYCVKRS